MWPFYQWCKAQHQYLVLDSQRLFANSGSLDDLETNKVVDFEAALIAYMNANQTTLMDKISKKTSVKLC
jgi:F0F1-type ATP synthase alpha subunit